MHVQYRISDWQTDNNKHLGEGLRLIKIERSFLINVFIQKRFLLIFLLCYK